MGEIYFWRAVSSPRALVYLTPLLYKVGLLTGVTNAHHSPQDMSFLRESTLLELLKKEQPIWLQLTQTPTEYMVYCFEPCSLFKTMFCQCLTALKYASWNFELILNQVLANLWLCQHYSNYLRKEHVPTVCLTGGMHFELHLKHCTDHSWARKMFHFYYFRKITTSYSTN